MSPGHSDARDQTRWRWLSWITGAALLVIVITIAFRSSEAREFAQMMERTSPAWLFLAILLQAGTYVAQGEVFRGAPRLAGLSLPRVWLSQLSLTKLFLDQALPSAGVSSAVVVARALERRGVSRGAVGAGVVINIATYHAAYVLMLLPALIVSVALGVATVVLVLAFGLFATFSVALIAALLVLSGRRRVPDRLARLPLLRGLVGFLEQADTRLSRHPRLLTEATAWQAVIFLLDAATMWVLIRSLGGSASASVVFASFMISSVFRTIGILPGGLGTYEASSVLTLQMLGVSVPVALSSTLIFRGLSFWVPMPPGLWFSRRAVGRRSKPGPTADTEPYWSVSSADMARRLESGPQGLTSIVAADRLRRYGPNALSEHRQLSRLRALLNQVRSPLLLLLLFAAAASGITREWFDAGIVLLIVVATVAIGYSREYGAQAAAAALRARVHVRVRVLRDGEETTVSVEEVVPGDVALLSAGSLVPADGVLLEASDFFVSESALTGESFPVEKQVGVVDTACPLGQRTNCVFLGTNVRSGAARCLLVRTGPSTEFGAVASRLLLRPPETEFDRGIRHFGYLLTTAMLVLVVVIFAAHMINGRPAVETLLFTVALAVGLSPELLPAILSVNLARGSRMMAQHGVLVRRLNAIENLGSMDILCTDKTGTLTEGVIKVEGAYDPSGAPCREVLELAALNASLETGLDNPLDDAIVAALMPDLTAVRKVAEIPFDYVRKRVTVVVQGNRDVRLVTKGAFRQVIDVCRYTSGGGALDEPALRGIENQYEAWGGSGFRAVAVAVRTMAVQSGYTRADEHEMTFVGFVTFLDQPKEGVRETLAALARLGVSVKLITGDSGPVARHVATLVGMRADSVLTGAELDRLHDEALWHAAAQTELFVEVDPRQKERIIVALKKMGHVVGFLGDGVNDAPAMHAADTSLSVEQAVDVARDAADFVLLERSLDVIRRGIVEGRTTFANTLKYVLITTSANLGNMVSMAVASLFMPFLPLLAGQILLNNFLSDIPAVGLADDSVDREDIDRPRRWNMRFIGSFMIVFGLVSALFDFLTFGALRFVFDAGAALFRTAWFAESLLTELVVALVIRTRRPFYRSRPGTLLLAATAVLVVVTFGIVITPLATFVGFVPLSAPVLFAIAVVTVLYVGAVEAAKLLFYGRSSRSMAQRAPLGSGVREYSQR